MEHGGIPWTIAILALPFLAAVIAPWLTARAPRHAALMLAIAPLAVFLHLGTFIGEIAAGDPVSGGIDWAPSLGLSLSWYLDGLSLVFGLLISGIGVLIAIYSGGYLADDPTLGRFLGMLMLFMGAMLGLVVADDFLTLFFFWEMAAVASFLLIGHDHEREAARRAALQALVITGMGGLALLGGLMLIGSVTGSASLSGLLRTDDLLRGQDAYGWALALILLAAFTKSAQFPFHFWLPNAMEAPTPVSAYLHSATMVKAGVYLLMRLNPVMGETWAWETLLPLFGGVTLVVGAVLAIRQTDLKLMLAYTTVGSLGLLVMMTGIGGEVAIAGAVLYLIAHALFKGALFLVVGAIDHQAGSRDVTVLRGLRHAMPVTFAATVIAALSMAGVPALFGFVAKEGIYEALLAGDRSVIWLGVVILGNAAMVVVAAAVALSPFLGRTGDAANEAAVSLRTGPLVLAVLGLFAGLASGPVMQLFAEPMAAAVKGAPVAIGVSAWPHASFAFALSVLTLALGAIGYWQLAALRTGTSRLLSLVGWGPDRGFDQAVRGLISLAVWQTRWLQSGRLDVYITIAFVMLAAALLGPMAAFGEWPALPIWPQLLLHEWALIAIAVTGLYAVVRTRDRLTAIVSLGIQGFAVAVLFLLMGAPDLSFTQFLVETLSVVILALVMTRLRLSPTDHRPWNERLADGAIALACGTGFCLLLLKVTQSAFDPALSTFFNAYARTLAHGRNVVNVIIVDFRGLDTLGEIAVMAVAGLVVLALIRIRTPAANAGEGAL